MPSIIILEDDPMISEIYQKKFEEAGFQVHVSDSGEKALEIAKQNKINAILLDLMMPKMNGFEVIKNLRSKEYDPNVKIIVFSNLSQKEDQDKALKLGADAFIIKAEFTPSTLVKEVQRIINQFAEEKRNTIIHEEQKANPGSSSKKKILFIEDEDIFIEMFGEKLKQDGFEVVSAQNGAWGLKEAISKTFDLFIIDMVMPAMGGDEIIQRLKLEEKTKNIPIIAFTASVDKQAEDKVKAMGVDAFYLKTQIIPSELSKKVSEILEKK